MTARSGARHASGSFTPEEPGPAGAGSGIAGARSGIDGTSLSSSPMPVCPGNVEHERVVATTIWTARLIGVSKSLIPSRAERSVGLSAACSSRAEHAAEPQVGGSGVDRLSHAGGRPVAAAVVGRAQVRAPLHHPAGNRGDITGIMAPLPLAAAWVGRRATGMGRLAVGLVPVAGPFPDVADHVVQAVAVRRVPTHRGGTGVAVQFQVLDRKITLPGV